jgi:putative flippase GtrA
MPKNYPHLSRAELETAFKNNQYDIFVQDERELVELWIAEQKSKGGNQQQIATKFQQLIGMPLDEYLMQFGKKYIVFKGRAGLRQILTGTRYLANNSKVMQLGIGGQAMRASAKGGVLISVIFSATLNTVDWIFKDEFRWTNWIASVSTDIVKAAIASAAGYAAGMVVSAGLVAITGASIAIFPLAAAILVGIGIGFALNWLDNKYGVTQAIINHLNRIEHDTKKDISDGVYYVISEAGRAVRRQLTGVLRSHLSSILRRFNGIPVLR